MKTALFISSIAWAIFYMVFCTGCMQLTGASDIDLWGAKFTANSGFDVSAGVMQYDHALNRKGINVEQRIPPAGAGN